MVLEAQQADAKLWQSIPSLVHDKAFSLNDALFEVTEVRGDLSSLLQPRPRVPSIPAMIHAKGKFKGSGKSSLPQPTASTKGDKGSGKSSSNPPSRPKWVTSLVKDGKKLQLCMQFQTAKCTRGDSCRFYHGCAYPKSDGTACGGDHGALAHKETTH